MKTLSTLLISGIVSAIIFIIFILAPLWVGIIALVAIVLGAFAYHIRKSDLGKKVAEADASGKGSGATARILSGLLVISLLAAAVWAGTVIWDRIDWEPEPARASAHTVYEEDRADTIRYWIPLTDKWRKLAVENMLSYEVYFDDPHGNGFQVRLRQQGRPAGDFHEYHALPGQKLDNLADNVVELRFKELRPGYGGKILITLVLKNKRGKLFGFLRFLIPSEKHPLGAFAVFTGCLLPRFGHLPLRLRRSLSGSA